MSEKKTSRTWKPGNRSVLIAGISTAILVILVMNATSGSQPATSSAAIDTTGAPVLQLDSDHMDFGDVPLNETVEASFKVTNAGDATLLFAEAPYVELKDGC